MLRLLEHPLSSYAQKIKIALREKGLPFTAETPESFGVGAPAGEFGRANPRGEVPVLFDGDLTLFESTVILEYLEDRWPEPPLLPRDPARRAQARLTEDVCDTQYEAINWGWGEILWFRRAEGELAEAMTDAAVAPVLNRSVHYGLGPEPGSPLDAWRARAVERPSVAETFAEFDAAAAQMAAAADRYRTGGRRREYRDHRLDWMLRSGGSPIVQAGMLANDIRFSWPA